MAVNPPPPTGGNEPGRPAAGRAREAEANDVSVLIAAQQVFGERGWSAPMSAVAERAGVGIGSLYRRYPSKQALGQALRVEAMNEISVIADECVGQLPAERVLPGFLERYLRSPLGPLVSVLGGRLPHPPEVRAAADRLHEALQRVAEVAHGCGQLPPDYGPTDLVAIIVHLRSAFRGDPVAVERFAPRLVEPLLTGLRAMASAGGRDSAAPAPRWDEWLAAWDRGPA